MEKFFAKLKTFIAAVYLFLFPLFFLPFTQDFFVTPKFYLTVAVALLLIIIAAIELLITKRIFWQKDPLHQPIILFLLTIGLSIVFCSPNKIQALLHPHFGLIIFIAFFTIYLFLFDHRILLTVLSFSSWLAALITVVFFFSPFKNINLPQNLLFLKNPSFSPIGGLPDRLVFFGFFAVLGLSWFFQQEKIKINKESVFHFLFFVSHLTVLSFVFYSLFKPIAPNLNLNQWQLIFPSLRLSWYAAVETLKNPLSAVFGVGINNFSSIFTRVKDLAYNQSILWQVDSFELSRTTVLNVLTEAGVFGLIAFGLLIYFLIKNLPANQSGGLVIKLIIYYLLLIIFILPPSLVVWFLLFFSLSLIKDLRPREPKPSEYLLADLPPVYFGLSLGMLIIVGISSYFLGRSYVGEFFYKKALDSVVTNNLKPVYENLRQANIFNPYIERYHISFSQINLIFANNLVNKKAQESSKSKSPPSLSEEDRQNIAQAIQTAIAEAKTAISLNPQKALNWENLAIIYRNIINWTRGADAWAIANYQRAIDLDPNNPRYYLNLGGIYYSLGRYEDAANLFRQAVLIKPDWPNAHYNLAWNYYQKGDYKQAVTAMENTIKLLNPTVDVADLKKAKKELEQFKNKLPKEEAEEKQPSEKLVLPTPPTKIEPKIELPKEASPEAR